MNDAHDNAHDDKAALVNAAIVIDELGGNCPVEVTVTIHGVPFYFRARGEHWAIGVGNDAVGVGLGYEDGWRHEEEWGDEEYAAGWMTNAEAMALIQKCVPMYEAARCGMTKPEDEQ